jgi:MFS family permease
MIAGRALKGIGAAAMIPGSLALIARAYPRADRGGPSASGPRRRR